MPYIASMGIYVFSKDVMLQLLREQFPGANDFGSEVIPGATNIGKRVCKDYLTFQLFIFFCLLMFLFYIKKVLYTLFAQMSSCHKLVP